MNKDQYSLLVYITKFNDYIKKEKTKNKINSK